MKLATNSVTTDKVQDSAITYVKIQDVSTTDRVLGRSTAGAGVIEEITCTAAGRALLDDADTTAQRATLGLGTVATLNVGTSANNVVQLDGSARLPAVDASQLSNIGVVLLDSGTDIKTTATLDVVSGRIQQLSKTGF